jgi:hypothetical protein
MAWHFKGPRPPYRWQRGLLLLCLPRRLIPGGFRDLPPGGPDESVSNPVGQTRPCQPGSFSNQLLMLGNETDVQGGSSLVRRVLQLHLEPSDPEGLHPGDGGE